MWRAARASFKKDEILLGGGDSGIDLIRYSRSECGGASAVRDTTPTMSKTPVQDLWPRPHHP